MGKIVLRLDRMMVERKMSLNELAERVGISNVNLSKIKNNKVTAIRFATLAAICDVLDCEAGDILEFQKEDWYEGHRFAATPFKKLRANISPSTNLRWRFVDYWITFRNFLNFFVTRYNTARPAVMSDVHFRHKMFSILDGPTPWLFDQKRILLK